MFFAKKNTNEDTETRIATIKALGESYSKKSKKENNDTRMSKLIGYLKDEEPSCRIAAAQALSSSNKEIVITSLCYYIKDEKDEDVRSAMKEALKKVRANIKPST